MNMQTGQHLSIINVFAEKRQMERAAMEATLLKTIMPEGATREDMAAFLQLAVRFDLDPWAKEIYCIKSRGKIMPYIGIDGYVTIVNRHPAFDNCEFEEHLDDSGSIVAISCRMFRKDRSRPITAKEYYSECVPATASDAWKRSPYRMLRHRAFIQAARLCFGISAAVDDASEANEIVDAVVEQDHQPPPPPVPAAPMKRVAPSPSRQKEQPKDEEKKGGHAADLKDAAAVSAEHDKYLGELNDALGDGGSEDEVKAIYTEWAPEIALRGSVASMDRAADLLLKHIRRTEQS